MGKFFCTLRFFFFDNYFNLVASISLSDCELKMLCLCCIAKIGKIHFGSVLLNKFQKLNLVFLDVRKLKEILRKFVFLGYRLSTYLFGLTSKIFFFCSTHLIFFIFFLIEYNFNSTVISKFTNSTLVDYIFFSLKWVRLMLFLKKQNCCVSQ